MKLVSTRVFVVFLCLVSSTVLAEKTFTAKVIGRSTDNIIQSAEQASLGKLFSGYTLFSISTADINQFVKESGSSATMRLQVDNQDWSLQVQPNDLRAYDYKMLVATEQGIMEYPRSEVSTYRGVVTNLSNSNVRLTIKDNVISGYVNDGTGRVFLEPLNKLIEGASADVFVMYNQEEVIGNPNASCEILGTATPDNTNTIQFEACMVADISIAADDSVVKYLGGPIPAEERFLTILNVVEGMYDTVTIAYRVNRTFISASKASDPWTTSASNGTLLSNFASWGANNGFGNTTHDVASLWIRRDIYSGTNYGVVGTANISSICNSNRYNILEYFTTTLSSLSIMQAHELGHNWSCSHDATNAPYIMAPSVGTSTVWSSASLSSINSFKSSRLCLSTCAIAPKALFTANYPDGCEGYTVTFSDLSYNGDPTSWSWSFPGGTPSTSNDTNPVVVYNTPGTYDVSLTVTNATGTDTKTKTGLVKVAPLTATATAPAIEGFETMGTFPGTGWSNINESGNAWEITNTVASVGTYSLRLINFSDNSIGSKDAFITPSYDFTNLQAAKITYRIATASRTATPESRLMIYVSTNCGQTWTLRSSKASTNLPTVAGAVTSSFVPGPNDWRYDSVSFSSTLYSGKPNVKFKFEFYNEYANNCYIDDINISGLTGIDDIATKDKYVFSVYPNPVQASSMLRFTLDKSTQVDLKILDMLGREMNTLYSTTLHAGNYEHAIGGLNDAGVYFVTGQIGGETIAEKFIVQ